MESTLPSLVDRNSDSLMVISFALEASLPGSASRDDKLAAKSASPARLGMG